MASSSIFITATDARQNPIRESVVHDEARAIETAILEAVKNGFFQTTLSSGSPMTGYGAVNVPVASIDLVTNALYVPNHPFKTGDLVTVSSTGTLPAPLVSTDYYSVIYIDVNHIKLASSQSAATNARPIDIDFTVGVTYIDVIESGTGYVTTPSVSVSPPESGNKATAIANLSTYGIVDSIAVLTPGSGYIDIPSVDINAMGTGAVAGTVWYTAVSASIADSGISYRVGDLLQCWPGLGGSTLVVVTEVDGDGSVIAIQFKSSSEYDQLLSIVNVPVTPLPTGGSGCTLNFVMGIARIDVANGGFGYISPPLVTIEGGNGTGATANAIINAGSVVGFDIISLGSGYTSSPTISLNSGSGATAKAVLRATGVGAVTIINNGSGSYATVPNVSLIAQGSGATVTEVTMKIVIATISNSGGGYTKGDVLLVAGGGGINSATIQVTGVGTLGEILSYTLVTSGSYTSLPILNNNSVTGGTGRSATFNLRAGLESISISSGGTGYIAPPAVIITPIDGNGSGAIAYSTIISDVVSDIVVTNAGTGYTSIPNVIITSGSGATAEAIIDAGSITEIVVTSAGENYTSPPIVDIDGIGTAYATLKSTGIARIEITNPGLYYTSIPDIQVIPNPHNILVPIQPSTVANIGYSIKSISVTNSGSGYNFEPDVTIAEPNGIHRVQATADAELGAGTGSMVVSLYHNSRDYWKVWKNYNPSNALYVRPYQERMDTVIAYFTNLGYTINRQTNPATGNTLQWVIMW